MNNSYMYVYVHVLYMYTCEGNIIISSVAWCSLSGGRLSPMGRTGGNIPVGNVGHNNCIQ